MGASGQHHSLENQYYPYITAQNKQSRCFQKLREYLHFIECKFFLSLLSKTPTLKTDSNYNKQTTLKHLLYLLAV
jgi:hypothetical protein